MILNFNEGSPLTKVRAFVKVARPLEWVYVILLVALVALILIGI